RLTLFLDTRVGRHLYGFVEARFDRGFDPRSRFAAAHLDAYLARWTPLDTPLLNLQFGKFATMIGTWAQRHDSWSNPFVTAPLPYENVTAISDGAAPATPQAFLARRNVPDRKRDWVPLVWGPNYTTGGAVFGRVGQLDYAAAVKNAALSARPEEADPAAYYLEGRYKLTPSLFGALRWNQQLFGEVSDGRGGERAWDRDVWRIDAALGYRFDRHLQAKLQYAFSRQTGRLQQGQQLVAAQVTLKF